MSELENNEFAEPSGLNSRKNSLFVVIGVGVVLLVIVLFQWLMTDDDYILAEQAWRNERSLSFKSDMDSPIPDSLRDAFQELTWYPVDRRYRITATFEKNPEFQKIDMPRSKGGPETYIIAGTLKFTIQGKKLELTAYQPNPKDSKVLFVPFRDLTATKGTYGGGRYIDTRLVNDKVLLDFNRAYNPYCVYNYDYACPIPPESNRLDIEIPAGEKDFSWENVTSSH
jgi:hypothetical protein